MIQYLYILWNYHHNKSSEHPSRYIIIKTFFFPVMRVSKIYFPRYFQICNTVIFTTITMFYITSLWLIYFITGSFYLWPLLPILPTTTLCLWQPPIISLYIWSQVFDFTCKWDHTIFVFSIWFTSFNLMPSSSIHIVTNREISFFLWLNIFYIFVLFLYTHIHIKRLYPFIHQLTLRLFPYFGYCK